MLTQATEAIGNSELFSGVSWMGTNISQLSKVSISSLACSMQGFVWMITLNALRTPRKKVHNQTHFTERNSQEKNPESSQN